jgi:N-acetylmuramic acid 6-phosphate etherase
VFRSREGAEDDRRAARRLLRGRLRRGVVVVGIAASGVTPFVDAALRQAKRLGARTILITAYPRSEIPADVRIPLPVGPELLTGSTRLKAGTATKLVLNRLTLGAMVQLGKTYGNLMVDVRPTSRKLRARAQAILRLITGRPETEASRALRAAHGQVKTAVLMVERRLSYSAARRRLRQAHDSLHAALNG